MKRHAPVALLATLMSTAAWGQEFSLFGTTMAQMWKQEVPGFEKASLTATTQYLGVDATKLGTEKLSLHFFGWGQNLSGLPKGYDEEASSGYLSYGYFQYRFDRANAEIKAGRFTAVQATGFEQVDGVSARTDLVNGFTVSAFAGKPVLYKTVSPAAQADYDFQRDFLFGTRLGWRLGKSSELGLSFLQDGSKAAKDLDIPQPIDYTRKQLGLDMLIGAGAGFVFKGRTVFDMASHPAVAPGHEKPSTIAEHNYTASLKLGRDVTFSLNLAERNFFAYFAGTNLPSLFRQDERDKFKGWGGAVTWNTPWAVQVVADYRKMHRESYGDSSRLGGELRWANQEKSFQLGGAAHYVQAADALFVDATAPYRSLTHAEARAWAMYEKGKLSLSLDGIAQRYRSANPYVHVRRWVREGVASAGYAFTPTFKLSGDLSYAATPVATNEVRGLLRAEYRFGFAKKGGR